MELTSAAAAVSSKFLNCYKLTLRVISEALESKTASVTSGLMSHVPKVIGGPCFHNHALEILQPVQASRHTVFLS